MSRSTPFLQQSSETVKSNSPEDLRIYLSGKRERSTFNLELSAETSFHRIKNLSFFENFNEAFPDNFPRWSHRNGLAKFFFGKLQKREEHYRFENWIKIWMRGKKIEAAESMAISQSMERLFN